MFVGQDRFKSAAREAISRRAEQVRAVRGGQWGRVPDAVSASGKSIGLRRAKKEQVATAQGGYFPKNVTDKRNELNARAIKRWMETDSAIKGGQ